MVAKKIEAGKYEYKGFIVRKSLSVRAGYWGSWKTLGCSGKFYGHSKKDVMNKIDAAEKA